MFAADSDDSSSSSDESVGAAAPPKTEPPPAEEGSEKADGGDDAPPAAAADGDGDEQEEEDDEAKAAAASGDDAGDGGDGEKEASTAADGEDKDDDDEASVGGDTKPAETEGAGGDELEDSDAEFDDNLGVSGRAATDAERVERERLDEEQKSRRAAAVSATAGRDREDGDHEGMDVDGDGDGGTPSGKKPPPKKEPPRRMGVLDIPRPDQLKKSSSLHMHVTKLPNFVGIQPEAYDTSTYDAKAEEEEYRGYVHNMIRWRYKRNAATGKYVRDMNGKLIRESNTRLVKWSDGSYTLHAGTETFEVDDLKSKVNIPGFAGMNGYLYMSQKATDPTADADQDDDGAVAGPTVLECMGRIESKLIPRPSSLNSEAHRNLTLAVRQRAVKKARIAEYVTQVDPEKEKEARIQNKNDLNRQAARGGKRGGGGRRGGGGGRRVNRRAEAEEETYDTSNLHDIKYRNKVDSMDYGDDSESGAEDEWSKRKTKGFQRGSRRPLGGYAESSSEEEEGDAEAEDQGAFGADSDDDDDAALGKARSKKRSHQAVVDEDDD